MTPRRPRLLDLFCGGGAAMGYHRAGFDVVGVDLTPQREYPFDFHLANALTFDLDGFDAVHASPPCKFATVARHGGRRQQPLFDPHDDLLTPTLNRFRNELNGIPWVIENVPGAPMPDPIVLCGSMFPETFTIRRHRLFISNVTIPAPPCQHAKQGPIVGVYGSGGADSNRANRPGSGGGTKVAGADAAKALGIDWTVDQSRLAQAIPPAYTEHIGKALREAIA